MHPLAKILIGVLVVVGSIAWIVRFSLVDLMTVLNGAIPPFVFLIGVFIIWLEFDEWRIERELRAEEEKAKRRKRKK
jgi:hypothetical protein